MITGKLMMIEIAPLRTVLSPNINHRDRRVTYLSFGRITTLDRYRMAREKYSTSKEVVFVGSTRVRYDQLDFRHESQTLKPTLSGATRESLTTLISTLRVRSKETNSLLVKTPNHFIF